MMNNFEKFDKLKTNQINLEETESFFLVKAYDQLKDVKTSMLRPKKTPGAEPDLSFKVKLIGSSAQGEYGPYRALYEDISKELQPTSNAQRSLNMFIPSINKQA